MTASTASMIAQFNMDNIELLRDMGFEVDVACNFEEGNTITQSAVDELKTMLNRMGASCFQVPFSRNPAKIRRHARTYHQLLNLLETRGYSFIHTHAPVSSAIVRLAARRARVPVVYTAHGFHFYKGGPVQNWLLYFPVEWALAKGTDTLITINSKDFLLAKKHLRARHIARIPGVGINTARFQLNNFDAKAYRAQLGIPQEDFVLLSIGELNDNKNHQVILEALSILGYPNVTYVIAGVGRNTQKLQDTAAALGVGGKLKLLGYRQDIPELCVVSDAFAFPSIREGLGLACLEAMASGLPVVAAISNGPAEYIVDGESGYLCEHDDARGFARAIQRLIDAPEQAALMGKNARETASRYDTKNVRGTMRDIYSAFLPAGRAAGEA